MTEAAYEEAKRRRDLYAKYTFSRQLGEYGKRNHSPAVSVEYGRGGAIPGICAHLSGLPSRPLLVSIPTGGAYTELDRGRAKGRVSQRS